MCVIIHGKIIALVPLVDSTLCSVDAFEDASFVEGKIVENKASEIFVLFKREMIFPI